MQTGERLRPARASSRSSASSHARRLGSPVRASVRAIMPSCAWSLSRWSTSALIEKPAIPATAIQKSAASGSRAG